MVTLLVGVLRKFQVTRPRCHAGHHLHRPTGLHGLANFTIHRWPAKVHLQGIGERHVHVFRSHPDHVKIEHGLACGVADHLSLREDSGAAHVVVVLVRRDDSRDGLVGDVGDGTFQRQPVGIRFSTGRDRGHRAVNGIKFDLFI